MNSLSVVVGNRCKLDCLPFDIIISILQLPILDIQSIILLAEIWPHYHQLVFHVLNYYQLPRIYLQTGMEQEGKRRYHSLFHFHSLDVINRRVTFMVQPNTIAKRYISNTSTAARPHLRHIILHTSSSSIFSHDHHFDSASSLSLVPDPAIQCSKIINTKTTKITTNDSSFKSNLIQSHPLSLKHGLHTFSCRQKRRTKKLDNSHWQFSYRVSYTIDDEKRQEQQKTEYMYVSPISLTVSLSTLQQQQQQSSSPKNIKSSSASYSWFEKYIKPKLSFL